MDHLKKTDIPGEKLAGRTVYGVFGAERYIKTDDASMSYCHVAPGLGDMEPHRHDVEVIYIVDAKDAAFHCGKEPGNLDTVVELEKDDVVLVEKGDWHRFCFTSGEGFIDLIAFFPEAAPQIETK